MVSVRATVLFFLTIGLAAPQVSSSVQSSAFAPTTAPPRPAPEASKLTPEQRGDVFMARKMYREAVDAYREGPQNSPVIWNKMGIAFHQLGDLASARKNYEKAMRLDKKYADAVNNVGTVFYSQKKYRTAIARYKKVIDMAPDTASFWSNLGTAYYSRGKFEDMAGAYQKALSLDPNIFEHRGTVGTEMQDRTVADRARYHFELARMYAHAGKAELALQYLRKALEEGLKDREKMIQAAEFTELRETEEFRQLVAMEPRVL